MNQLKLKIKLLENKIRQDKADLSLQRYYLHEKFGRFKTNYYAAELIVGGFAVGFLLGTEKFNNVLRLGIAQAFTAFSTMGMLKRYLSYFS